VLVLHRRFPETRIVLLADRPTTAECTQMLAYGATGCLSKETEARDVVRALHLASRGMHVLPRSAAAGGELGRLGRSQSELTNREAEVAELLKDGWTNAQIAKQLSIGIETVRTHARNIYRKLGINSRRELGSLRRGPSRLDGEHGKDVGAGYRDEGHRGEHGAAGEGLEETGRRGGAGSHPPSTPRSPD
jgi:DNA-binding NarL/FixJ family response regulator